MPLDGHTYLVSQGWQGKGQGLRDGAISRPVATIQKKNLGGVGQDRDEAFPFWDHLFSAAAKSIKIKTTASDSSEEENDSDSQEDILTIKRTSTGILSTRKPLVGTPADSGPSTPRLDNTADTPRPNLLSVAKKEAARRNLYSRFYKGPILGPDDPTSSTIIISSNAAVETLTTFSTTFESASQSRPSRQSEWQKTCPVESTAEVRDERSNSTSEQTPRSIEKRARKEARGMRREAKAARSKEKAARKETRAAKREEKARKELLKAAASTFEGENRKDHDPEPLVPNKRRRSNVQSSNATP